MKKLVSTCRVLGCVWLLVSGLARQTSADGVNGAADKAEKPARVAVIDYPRVLQNYGKSKDFLAEFRADQEQAKAELDGMKEKFNESAKLLSDLKPGSADFTKKESELTKQKTNIEILQRVKERDLTRRRYQINKIIHDDVQDAITKVSDHYGYGLVVSHTRYDSENLDPRALQMALSQPVVWCRKRDDITDAVVEVLNRRYEKSASAVTPASATKSAGKKAAARPAAAE